jgi:methylthioribose-1-phosphate isomerase
MVETVRWDGNILWVLDQTKLPLEIHYEPCSTVESVAKCIQNMLVRGAPAIGVTAVFGMLFALKEALAAKQSDIIATMRQKAGYLNSARPTAVNLMWATNQVLEHLDKSPNEQTVNSIESLAVRIYRNDIESCRKIGCFSGPYIPDKASILTHCNAGALATAGYGTALGVIRRAVEDGKSVSVFADETRPLLQGSRLTAWELQEDNIDVTLITDSMAAHLMSCGEIDLVVVGADRIASNGDTANKIGTLSVALAAQYHAIPFYVAAPVNTIDPVCSNGSDIPIEERSPEEVSYFGGIRTAPPAVKCRNPAFDITPAALITAIFTDKGVLKPDYKKDISLLFGHSK